MRTLKKSLCLVLALVMVLGLCMIGTNAADYAKYTDLEKVNYTEAVEVLTGLGVIEGYPDGTFNPTANVTRAEAAAMIARMMLGREDADKLPVGDVKFTDVPETNWAAKYIAFCANKGIIVGMGDGTFRPAENVTGTQMATMLLRALGYGVMGEYEGKGWDINAVADALYYGIFKDSEVTDFNQPATREENALYVWNTMWVTLVGYDVDRNYYDPKGTTFARKAFNLVKWEYAQLLANQATGDEYTVVEIVTGYTPKLDKDGKEIKGEYDIEKDVINLDIETGLDLIGHEVTVYFKDELKEDKVNHCDYYVPFFVKDTSTVIAPYSGYSSFDDLYRALKSANKENVAVDLRSVPLWMNYQPSDLHVGGLMDFDAPFNTYYTIEQMKSQKSSNDKLAWFFNITKTWILDHKGDLMLVLDTSHQLGKVKAIDSANDEIEVKVWTTDSYYYMPQYELYEEDDPSGNGYYKKGDRKFDFTTNSYVTKKDKDGNDLEDKAFDHYAKYDYYYVNLDTDKPVYTEGKKLAESTTQFPEDLGTWITIPGIGKYSLLKSASDSYFVDEVFDTEFKGNSLVYDGIAKDDYVVVQPVGDLIYLQPTGTSEEEITDVSYSGYTFNGYSKDSNWGIPVDDAEEELDNVGVGDLVKFYTVPGSFGTNYFAVEILESATAVGYVYLNYAAVTTVHSDWGTEQRIRVQLIDENGEELVYSMKPDNFEKVGTIAYESDGKTPKSITETKVGLYGAKVRKGYVTLTDPEELVEFTKKKGRNSYVTGDGNNYYVTSDTKVIYFTKTGEDLEITIASKLGDRNTDKDEYKVYGVSKKSSGTYKLKTVWVNADAPAVYSDKIIFVMGNNSAIYGQNDDPVKNPGGSKKNPKNSDAVMDYYSVYLDGSNAAESIFLVGDDAIFQPDSKGDPTEKLYRGFYRYSYDEETDVYTLYAVASKGANAKCREKVVLSDAGANTVIYDKKNDAYLLVTDGSDSVELNCKIVDISGDTTKGTKEDTAINSYDRLCELLELGYKVTINYMFVTADENEIPTGVIYVTDVNSASAKD